jgi:putative endonuclease
LCCINVFAKYFSFSKQQSMKLKDSLGYFGETLACNHLQSKGFVILHRNWRSFKFEIDIIAQKDEYIVIVEVKTRTSIDFGEPYSFVSKKKQSQLVKAAQRYADISNIDCEMRFDIISIVIQDEQYDIEHIEHAFTPLLGM